ncbi:MAG TPA: VTT domain-containing protein [Candidatus Polarisedimenticolia bacterium]|nr:VTT domain-containing protein [Candidatus Polarisedimenticolia bacterium]
MTDTTRFLTDHGLPLVFAAVLVEQMGLPLPAFPWLLAAGALAADGRLNPASALALAVAASLLADGFWFYWGRRRGLRVLRMLCWISLEPDSCVRRTQDLFGRYGRRSIAVNKFLPGVSTVVPPLAGMIGTPLGVFLALDAIASLLYAASLLGLGYVFHQQIDSLIAALHQLGGSALGVLLAMVASYLAFKWWQRERVLRELRMIRITADELRRKLEAHEPVLVLDVRPRSVLQQDDTVPPGARHVDLDEVERGLEQVSLDHDIVVYCDCPNEISAARVALRLQHLGFKHVRPLLGGLDGWRTGNHPVESLSQGPERAEGDAVGERARRQ